VPADEPAVGGLPDLTGWLGRHGSIVTSPARRCRVAGAPVEHDLRPWDLGTWTGQPFEALDLAAWRSDVAFDAHGGESLLGLSVRVQGLLDRWQAQPGRTAAVTHAALIKVAVVLALRAPLDAVWDVDVTPGSVTELHAAATGWRLTRLSCKQ
jgi:broad specificity phosphatase PhoE